MISNLFEYIETLVKLGLTHRQAEVYMALVCLKTGSARDIHKVSDVARQDVYRIVSELENRELIERVIDRPTRFRPIAPNEAISILLKKRRNETCLLEKEAIHKFRKLQNSSIETPIASIDSQFILLSRGETNPIADFNRLRETVSNAQKSIMSLTNFELFRRIKFMDEQSWKKAIKRGVKLRFITNKPAKKWKIKLDPSLANSDNFEIKWTNTPPSTSVLLVDEKEGFFRLGLDFESPVLLVKSLPLVEMLKDYFETKWESL